MHRGPAAYVLGPPPSRGRDLELEGGFTCKRASEDTTLVLGLLKKEEEECQIAIFYFAQCIRVRIASQIYMLNNYAFLAVNYTTLMVVQLTFYF